MADNITLKDGLGNLLVMRTTNAGGINTSHSIVDSMPPLQPGVAHIGKITQQLGGEDISATNPMPVLITGSVFMDNMPPLSQGDNHIGRVTPVIAGSPINSGNPMPVVVTGAGIPIQIEQALPTGANTIGKVVIENLPVLPAGTNVIGKVVNQVSGSDVSPSNPMPVAITGQPITVNVNPLPTGTNNIGLVTVAGLPAIPAGLNHIGKVTPQIAGQDVSQANPLPVRFNGGELSATVTSALPQGSNTIGKVIPEVYGDPVTNDNPMPVRLTGGTFSSFPPLATGSNVIGRIIPQVRGADVSTANPVPVSIFDTDLSFDIPDMFNVVNHVGGAEIGDTNPMPVKITSGGALSVTVSSLGAGTAVIGKVVTQVAGADVSDANRVPVKLDDASRVIHADGSDVGVNHPLPIRGMRGSVANGSGSIVTGGVSQEVLPANANRRFFMVQNLSNDDLWLNFGLPANMNADSIKISPDGAFSMDNGYVSTDPINLVGASAGQQFVLIYA